jgi:lipopolysaccharide export system permease protein
MAMLLAILVAFGRLSADSEITALRSSGVSLYQLVPPVATFVVIVTMLTAGLAWYGRPWGNRAFRTAMWDIARTRATAGLKPQIFNDEFPGLIIYAEQIDAGADRLERVLIADERDPQQQNTVFATAGYMISDFERETVTLRLLDGTIHTTDTLAGARYQTDFQSYDVNLDLRATLASAQHTDDPSELTIGQLRSTIDAKRDAGRPATAELVEYHRKFAIPFACIVFALIALPLGIQPARTVRSRGFAVSLVVIFAYYMLLSTGQGFAEQGRVPPALGLWLPNLVLGAVGVTLIRRAGREQPLASTTW